MLRQVVFDAALPPMAARVATSAVDAMQLHHLRERRGTFGLKLSQSGIPDFAVANLFGLFITTNCARPPR